MEYHCSHPRFVPQEDRFVAGKDTRAKVAKTPDIRGVAALAKVSIATVSRTINGSSTVSDRLQERVWQAINQLNYFPNTNARSLVSGHSRILGIIVGNITNPFFPELIQSFEEIAVAHGYEILVSSSNSDPAVLTTCVRRMLERKVEGVAVLSFGAEEPVLDQLVHRDIPMVLAEFHLDDPKVSTILLDYKTGIRAAIGHLKALGHSKIAFLAGPHKLHSAVTRANDYRTAMEALKLPIEEKWLCRVRPHPQGRRGRIPKAASAGPAAHRHCLLQRHDRHRRPARRLSPRPARSPGSLRHRPRRHLLRRVHPAPAHHHPPLAHRLGPRRL